MPQSVKFVRLALISSGALLISSAAMAAGFEKAQTWSAKSAAMGGAVVGSTAGAEALYFNPAGLAESSTRGEVSLNFSPTLSKFNGTNPYFTGGPSDGKSGFSPVAGIVASFKPTRKLGIGAGFYVSGGTKSEFDDLDYSAQGTGGKFDTLRPTVKTDLSITEAALGAGYEVMPGLRIGAALRAVMVHADFSTVTVVTNAALIEAQINNISATRYNGFKLGAQYEEPFHRWGLGINYRSAVQFTAHGDTSARRQVASGTIQDLGTGSADLDNSFPMQIALGGWTRATELLRIGYEYSYTNYNQDKALNIRGSTSGGLAFSNIPQQWKNMHVVRLGGEYSGMGLPLRFGYAFTSQVTPGDYARSTFASPGPGHSLTVGTGMILSNNIDLDGALEYAWAAGTGHNQNAPVGGTPEIASDGSFSSHAYAAHLSAKYRF